MRILMMLFLFSFATVRPALLAAAEPPDDEPPKAYPAQVIHLDPPTPKDPVLEALELIQEQNARLEERLDKLEKTVVERTEPPPERIFETGIAFAFRQGDVGRFIIEANLAYVNGYLILPGGGGVGIGPTIEAWRFRIRPIAAGLLWNFDRRKPLTVRAIPRDWDFLVSTGADMLVWRGLQVRFQVFWSFPNPGDVLSYAADRMADDWEKYRDSVEDRAEEVKRSGTVKEADQAWERAKDDADRLGNDLRSDGDIFGEAYKKAGRLPYFVIGLRWEF